MNLDTVVNFPDATPGYWFDLAVRSWCYYCGLTSIMTKERVSLIGGEARLLPKGLPNSQVSCDLVHSIVQQRVHYLLSRPLRVVQDSDETGNYAFDETRFGYLSRVVASMWSSEKIHDLVRDVIVGGYVWVYPFLDNKGNVHIHHLPAWECRDVISRKGDVVGVVREAADMREFYSAKGVLRQHRQTKLNSAHPSNTPGSSSQCVGVWDCGVFQNHSINLDMWGSAGYLSPESRGSGMALTVRPRVPLYRLRANDLGAPFLRGLDRLVDLYDAIASNWADAVLQYPDGGILVVSNVAGDSDDLAEMLAQTRILELNNSPDAQGDAHYLDIPDNPDSVLKILKYLQEKIYMISGGFDESGDYAKSNLRTEVLRAMQSTLRVSCDFLAREIVSMIKAITPIVIPELRNNNWHVEFEDREYRSLDEITNLMVSLGLKISNETLLRNYPLVGDVALELSRIAAEKDTSGDSE